MKIKLVECPRDAMQGLKEFIPTKDKIRYINKVLEVGYDTVDFGSFVSPKWVPQLSDTKEVLKGLNLSATKSKLLAIVANLRGAQEAAEHEEIKYLGFPFSISEVFQKKNLNATLRESLGRVEDIQVVHNICAKTGKEMVVYISMGFGNPYGDPWSVEIMHDWMEKLWDMGIRKISLSDTVGVSKPSTIIKVFNDIIFEFPDVEIGAHFHTMPSNWQEKVETAFDAGCRWFDGAISGFGGCPMAATDLVGNMPMENLVHFFKERDIETGINYEKFHEAFMLAQEIFPKKHVY